MKAASCAYSQTVQCMVHVWSGVTCALDVPLPGRLSPRSQPGDAWHPEVRASQRMRLASVYETK